jgi:3-hydroxybutyryl-CoA dehydrogenase
MSAESLRVPRWANPSRATIAGGGFMTDITLPDPNAKDLLIGIAGAGLMGRGIAQVAVQGGCRVKLYDASPEAGAAAVDFVRQMFTRAAEKGQIPAEVVEAIVARVQIVGAVADLADCAIVIEAIAENLDAKHALFAELDQVCAPDAILASNTSMLSITTIASVCQRPERVAGMHFFNPVPVMKLVEVIDGLRGHDAVGNVLMDLARRFGREPVRVSDTPGFIVNQVGRGYGLEAAHIAAEGAAPFEALDRILREACGFRMGPFELMDLTSLDVTQPASELLYRQFFDEPRYRPTPLMRMRYEAGLLGRKTGRGFYDYDADGNKIVEPEGRMPHYDERWVWVASEDQRTEIRMKGIIKAAGGVLDENKAPHPKSLIVITPLGEDATSCATRLGVDATQTVAIDSLFGIVTRRTVMKTSVTKLGYASCALGLFSSKGARATLIHDTPGFVAQRIIASIVNIASSVAQSGVAAPEDIDKAVMLGLGYPKGPLAWGDELGPRVIVQILKGMHDCTGDAKYRPSPWLRRRAQLNVSLLTPEA